MAINLSTKLEGLIKVTSRVPLELLDVKVAELGVVQTIDDAEDLIANFILQADGSMTSAERLAPVDIPFLDFKDGMKKTSVWTRFIGPKMHLSEIAPEKDVMKEAEVKDGNVEFKYTVDGENISDGTWDKDTGFVTLKARPSIDFNFGSFLLWVEFLDSVVYTIERVKK